LETRKQEILKAVVQEFTTSALPVGSQALASRHFIKLSSATIRNELAELSDLGYLIQPHTSAGRIPSDRGYRYFVDFLMDTEPVPARILGFIEEEIRQTPGDAQAVVEKVAMTTAAVTDNASLVTSPHGPQARVKHVDLVSLEPGVALLILLVEGNLLRQQLLDLPAAAGQAELSRIAGKLNRELGQKDREEVASRLQRAGGEVEKAVLAKIGDALEHFERGAETLVVHDGVRNLLRQPEFAESSRLHQVLEVLEETRYLAALLRELIGESDLQIVIGSENATAQLQSCTVLLTTYGPSARLKGVLGVVGPTRMQYPQVVSRMQAIARAAGARLAEIGA